MADIAFLLLIFFLVTTSIETDSGIDRIMPPLTDSSDAKIKERNILRIEVNDRDELFVEEKLVQIEDLKEIAVGFLDNGGATLGTEDFCDYCRGHRDLTSSDNPSKAVISLTCQRETGYGAYITIQNELVAAYNELRNRESQRLFKEDYSKMVEHYESPGTPLLAKERLKERIQRIQKLFPQKIAEVKIE